MPCLGTHCRPRPPARRSRRSQAKRGEDFTFLKVDCERLPGVPSSSCSTFGVVISLLETCPIFLLTETTLDMAYYARRGGDRFNGRIQGGGGRGGYVQRGRSGMPPRGPLGVNTRPSAHTIAKSFSRNKDMTWRPDLFSDSMAASGIETGTKLYISNLDYGVSNEDIKELFSEVGHLKRFAVHFDGYGRPNGTAEVVFTRRSDAIAALKRYNNVLLDGKAMKIEVIGSDLGLPMTPRINVVGASNGRPTRTVVMTPEIGQRGSGSSNRATVPTGNRWNRGAFQAGRGRGRGRGRAPFQAQFQGRGRGRGQFRGRGRGMRQTGKTADQLDKDLDTYHAEAMKTD
ncbi:hypothetical protein GUJ93_ZPchr0010g9110 [Zizania palustris]|uniref:RRM domain-containing protein n=1 Tax=Zizania palustris TaxID=103762 RepID=A0A8J6BQ67_ZIZPA|nr:hypothetical protein GUJ93_ZPchr0010g9110 [Zizania palustris]